MTTTTANTSRQPCLQSDTPWSTRESRGGGSISDRSTTSTTNPREDDQPLDGELNKAVQAMSSSVRRLSKNRGVERSYSTSRERILQQSKSSLSYAGARSSQRSAHKLSRSILQQEREQHEYQMNGDWIESLRSDASTSSASSHPSGRKQQWNGGMAHTEGSSQFHSPPLQSSVAKMRPARTNTTTTWSDAEASSGSLLAGMSVEAKMTHIREALKNEKKVAGGGSLSQRTLSSFVVDLLNSCDSFLETKKEMLQHRSILAQEVEKVWRICDERERSLSELQQQYHILQAVNADLEATNTQLVTRLNTAIDAALSESSDKAHDGRSRSYPRTPRSYSSVQSSPSSSQHASPASGPMSWAMSNGVSMLTSDAALQAKYALMDSNHDGNLGASSIGSHFPSASSRKSSPRKSSSGRRSVVELLTGQPDVGPRSQGTRSPTSRSLIDSL